MTSTGAKTELRRVGEIKQIGINPYIKDKEDMFELGIKELLWLDRMEDVYVAHSAILIRKYS